MVQPINYGAMALNPMMSGIQTGLGLGQAVQQRRALEDQAQQREQQQALRQQAAELYSTGTPDQIAQFSIQNPDLGKAISDQMQFKSDQTKANMIQSMQGILANPENTEQILMDRIKTVQDAGGDPSQTVAELQRFRQNPEGYTEGVERAYAMMDPTGYNAFAKTRPGTTEPMTEYQSEMIRQKDTEQELKRLELEGKDLDRQVKRETDQLRKQELEQKIAENKRKSEEAQEVKQKEKQQAIVSTEQTLESVNDLLNHPGLSSAVGKSSILPTIPGTEKANFATALEQFVGSLTMENMGVMKGVLSDSDIKMIRSASAGLETGMTEKAFVARLNKIRDRLQEKLQQQGGVERQQQPAEQQQAQTVNWADL